MKKFYTSTNKLAGVLYDDGVFRKKVSARKHLFHKLDAFGIDMETLKSLSRKNKIRILDTDDGTVYFTTVARWWMGEILHFKEHKIDHGTQVFFPRKLMGTEKDGVVYEDPIISVWWNGILDFENKRGAFVPA